MSAWTKQKLGDIVDLQQGLCINKKSRHLLCESSKLPLLRITDLINNKQEQYINPYLLPSQFIADKKSLIYTRTGQVGLVFKDRQGVVHNNCFKITPKNGVNKDFLFYVLKQKKFYLKAVQIASKSAQADLTHAAFNSISVNLPSVLSVQTEIASILSAYDDLIENNEKRIKILEEMAERLYREWFVKFKFPGHEKVPLIDSGTEYGKIPEGWRTIPMSTLANFINGYPFKPKDLGEYGLPIIKIPELRSGILDKTPRNSGKSIPKKYLVESGDIIFSWSATLLVNIWRSGNALLNQHLFKVTPKKIIFRSYLFYTLMELVKKLSKQVVGATMQHLRRDTIVDAKVILPAEELIEEYEKIAANLLGQINFLCEKNQKLSKMRDLLISQLVTGKRETKKE